MLTECGAHLALVSGYNMGQHYLGVESVIAQKLTEHLTYSFRTTASVSKAIPSTNRLLQARRLTRRLHGNLETTSHHVLPLLYQRPRQGSIAKRSRKMRRMNMFRRYRQWK
jgi:hypothetical protein